MDIKRQEHPALFDFDVINDGTLYREKTGASLIYRASVPKFLVKGVLFNVSFGDDSYTPRQKTLATWLDTRTPEELPESELIEAVKKAIRESDIYKALNIDSEEFYSDVAKKYCRCQCDNPKPHPKDQWSLLAADLEYPWYPRASSRWVAFLTVCEGCFKPLTGGTTFASFCTVGEDDLKAGLEKELKGPVNLKGIITSRSELKKAKVTE